MQKKTTKARRYNKGKLRYELIPQEALQMLANVYTRGAHKYTIYEDENGNIIDGKNIPFENLQNLNLSVIDDGADNWRKGQKWTESMGSIKRHIELWVDGEDLDSELGTYHLANAAWGLFSLLTYYKIYPQGDDRKHSYLNYPRIGLDIDEVLASFLPAWCKYWKIEQMPTAWFFDRDIKDKFEKMREEGVLDEFYLKLEVLTKPSDLGFEPHCYVTSRPVSTEITQQWLDKMGFPHRPVYTVGLGESKVKVIQESGCDIFIDDRFDNFVELNKAGICTYLFDAPHNQRYDVGYKRIFNFQNFLK